jgi:GT2 family glycosyltransferase
VSHASRGRISVIVVALDAPVDLVRASVDSIRDQTADDWELCVVTGPTGLAPLRAAVDVGGLDKRISLRALTQPEGDAAALADAVASTSAEFVTWLDAGDLLEPVALERVLASTAEDADFVYTDEDQLDSAGRANIRLKPDWSPDRLRAYPYTGRLAVFRRTALDDAGGIRPELALASDHDVSLRVGERARRIVHVAEVLYHQRSRDVGTTSGPASSATLRAVAEYLERVGFPATVEPDREKPHLLRFRPALTTQPPVSIVIPTGGHRRVVHGRLLNLVANCVASVVRRSTYPDYEILCVVDETTDKVAVDELVAAGGDKLRIILYRQQFNFARKINVGALHAQSDFLVFLNDDTEVISPDWIESLLMFASDPTVGAVGAKLRFADRRLQHVGTIAVGGNVGHQYYGFPADFDGHMDNARTPTNCIAVTAACLMTRRDCFETVGGLSLQFPLNYNDIDYGLKLYRSGYRNVFNPYAELYHFETSSRATGSVSAVELEALRERWGSVLRRDPYYNPGFGGLSDFVLPLSVSAAAG